MKQNVETTQQPTTATENASLTPNFFKKWNQIVADELRDASELAATTFNHHIEELTPLICEYLHKGCQITLLATKVDLVLYHMKMSTSGEKNLRLSQIWVCNQPSMNLRPLSPEAQKEYFRVYLQLLKEEYGNIEMNEYFELNPYDYLSEVIPDLVIPTRYSTPMKPKASQDSAPTHKNEEQTKPGVVMDDIESMFARRGQNM